ncbi:MAG TPA: tetratricopeptide repeat protein [Planktothrix sp.]|jgi:tetratricopeptide (TPR) repeat protein
MTSSWDRYKTYAEQATAQGCFDDAEAMWLAALEEAEQFGLGDPRLPLTLEHLADVELKQGKIEVAEELYKKALTMKASTLGPFHLDVGASANNLAELYCSNGKFEAAEPLYKRVLRCYETAFGQQHVGVAIIATNLAIMYHAQEKYSEAEPLYQRALNIHKKISGVTHPETIKVTNNYVDLLNRTGREQDALRIIEESRGSVSGVWKRSISRMPHSTLANVVVPKFD